MSHPLLSALAISLLWIPGLADARAPTAYPLNALDRPLVLPKGTGELTLGPAWLEGNERYNLQPFVDFRYALSENLEIARIGLRYRYLKRPRHQQVIELQYFGLNPDLNHHTEVGFYGRSALRRALALEYGVGAFFANSHEKDGKTYELRPTIGTLVKLTPRSALNVQYAYRLLSGFNTRRANLLKLNVSYTLTPALDVGVSYSYSEFNDAVDSVLSNESYRSRYDAWIRWRF